jgi:hypothetical protein
MSNDDKQNAGMPPRPKNHVCDKIDKQLHQQPHAVLQESSAAYSTPEHLVTECERVLLMLRI